MMVPRAFPHIPSAPSRENQESSWTHSKKHGMKKATIRSTPEHPVTRLPSASTSPVRIPSRRHTQPLGNGALSPIYPSQNPRLARPQRPHAKLSRTTSIPSVDALLASTSIPLPRRLRRKQSQKLPDCDHVAEFSKLLQEDLSTRQGVASGSLGNPQYDMIFGSPNERQDDRTMNDGEEVGTSVLSTRSASSESMPSLENDTDSATTTSLTDVSVPLVSIRRSLPAKSLRKLSTSQECKSDHPLLPSQICVRPHIHDEVNEITNRAPRPSFPRSRQNQSAFRSNLTASLKALKNAAQVVSSLALSPPMHHPDDFLTRSIFNLDPSLTDDKRPPQLSEPPSPALRRYLNPTSRPPSPTNYSPAEMLTFSDLRTDPDRNNTSPSSIQLQTYLPPLHQSPTGSSSSPPIFSSHSSLVDDPDTLPAGSGVPASRPREVRENGEFLRIFVCELAMRRAGKFSEQAEGRAKLWLPPRRESQDAKAKKAAHGEERWNMLTA